MMLTTLRHYLQGLLMLTGLVVAVVALLLIIPQWRLMALGDLQNWLEERSRVATAYETTPSNLPAPQALVAQWLAQKYRIHPQPMAILVAYAYALGESHHLPPHLILAVAAIESNFHPYIQSSAGAQGLMQIMPHIHRQRFAAYGGKNRSFDPLINMRVGADILLDCIRLKGGSVEKGLQFYFAGDAVNDTDGGGYFNKVTAEQARLDRVAMGEKIPPSAP